MHRSTRIRAVALGAVAALAAIAVPSAASAAVGDPAAIQATGASVPNARPAGTVFLTNIDVLTAASKDGTLNGASKASFQLNVQGVAAVQAFSIVVNPTCQAVKGKVGYVTGLASLNGVGASPIAMRFTDNTNAPPGTADETPDRMQFSFAVDNLNLTRCSNADLLGTFNVNQGAQAFPLTTGFVIVHEDEPAAGGPPKEQGNTPNPIPAPNPVPIQNVTPAVFPIAPTAPVALTPVASPQISQTTTSRRVCRRVVVRRNGRVLRRHGRVVKRSVCRTVRR